MKEKVTQPEASPLSGDNASHGVPQDAMGLQGKVIKVSTPQTSGGTANTTKGVGN